jgi:TolA-binding protein
MQTDEIKNVQPLLRQHNVRRMLQSGRFLRFRIFSDHMYSKHYHNAYFAGWIDDFKEAKKSLKDYVKQYPNAMFRLDVFGAGEKFVGSLRNYA